MKQLLFRIIYQVLLSVYYNIIRIAAIRNPKATAFLEGRKYTHFSLQFNTPQPHQTCIWFHCASLGEFEQAKPIIERLKEQQPHLFIAISFYSPSGFVPSQNYPHANWMGYLPFDTPKACAYFLDQLKPQIAVFVKYELWPELLYQINKRKLPHYLVSARFSIKNNGFARIKNKYFQYITRSFTTIFAQDQSSFDIAAQWKNNNLVLSGDTRVDRVIAIKAEKCEHAILIQAFKQNKKLLIVGSSWETEEKIVMEALPEIISTHVVLIAPHKIDRSDALVSMFSAYHPHLFTDTVGFDSESSVMILNTMGMLSKLYRYADVAFVGGGFKNALHNCFEPLAYEIPIIFGPYTQKFQEASTFKDLGIARAIQNKTELIKALQMSNEQWHAIQLKSKNYLRQNQGVADQISSVLLKKLKNLSHS